MSRDEEAASCNQPLLAVADKKYVPYPACRKS